MEQSDAFSAPMGVSYREVGGQILIMNMETGGYYELNETGAYIWEQLVEGKDVGAVCAAVCAEFEADAGQAATDVARLVDSLLERGLLEPA